MIGNRNKLLFKLTFTNPFQKTEKYNKNLQNPYAEKRKHKINRSINIEKQEKTTYGCLTVVQM